MTSAELSEIKRKLRTTFIKQISTLNEDIERSYPLEYYFIRLMLRDHPS